MSIVDLRPPEVIRALPPPWESIFPILDGGDDNEAKASYLENFCIPVEDWYKPEVPLGAQRWAKGASSEGCSAAIAHHPKYGWFVLVSQGQGPGIGWADEDGYRDEWYTEPEPVPEGGLFILRFGEDPKAWTEGTGDI